MPAQPVGAWYHISCACNEHMLLGAVSIGMCTTKDQCVLLKLHHIIQAAPPVSPRPLSQGPIERLLWGRLALQTALHCCQYTKLS